MRPTGLPAAAATALLVFVMEVVSQDYEDTASLPAGSEAILSSPYVDTFSCEGQAYGYFADVDNNCEVRTRPTYPMDANSSWQFKPNLAISDHINEKLFLGLSRLKSSN